MLNFDSIYDNKEHLFLYAEKDWVKSFVLGSILGADNCVLSNYLPECLSL